MLIHQTVRTLIVVSFGLIIVLFIRHSKSLLSKHVGVHLAAVFQFFMVLVVGIVVVFASLDIFQVSPTTLLVGGGIASIVIGLVISTFVGNILAGTLVLMTRPFSVGDTVMVNNIPGKVEEITAMVTRIRNDIGGLVVIPNTAIVQGGVIVTTFPASEEIVRRRLPYSQGDRVYTTYLNQEGIVRKLTPFYTTIQLDSGRELTFLNSSVLTGNVAVAKISQNS
jgi:small-conductance mechanosensitive channel